MIKTDVLIVGGGPAGLGAAIETTKAGLRTIVVDENQRLGGQLIKQTHKFFGSSSHFAGTRGILIQDELVKEMEKGNLKLLEETACSAIFDDGIAGIYDVKRNRFEKVKAKRTIIAAGASEKFIPFRNNDLPGIYGAGGVQTLMNAGGVLPGKKILMIGAGNIGLIVSYQLLQAGASVVGIIEAAPKQGGYEVHLAKIKRMGVPVLFNHSIIAAEGKDKVEAAVIGEIDKNWKFIDGKQRRIECDTICLAVGLTPTSELLWQAGVEMMYLPALGGYVPRHNEYMQTNVPGILVAGDAAGIGEATSAIIEGRLAGLSAAKGLKVKMDFGKRYNDLLTYLDGLRRGSTGFKVKAAKNTVWNKKEEIKGDAFARGSKTKRAPEPGRKKPYIVIECDEDIPCNPCEASCSFKAIEIGQDITNPPVFDAEKCTGCLKCITSCPGLAIFGIAESGEPGKTVISIPYEMLPLPEKGDKVWACGREGEIICEAVVHSVRKSPNKTHIASIIVDGEYKNDIRHFIPFSAKDAVICRCLDITCGEIEEAISRGYTDFEELKRYLRVTTGPCQGRTCRSIIMGMIKAGTGIDPSKGSTGTRRPPEASLPFSAFVKKGRRSGGKNEK